MFKLPAKFAGLRLIREDGDASDAPYVVLQNDTGVYSLINDTFYPFATSDLSDLADDIATLLEPLTDNAAPATDLPIYQTSETLGDALTLGNWDVIVLAGNDYVGTWDKVLPAYYDGTYLWDVHARAAAGVSTQGRAVLPAGSEFRLTASDRGSKRGRATRRARVSPGLIDGIRVELDVSQVFGGLYVTNVGVPSVATNKTSTAVICSAVGPSFDGRRRDCQVMLGGTLAAGEVVTISFVATVQSGESDHFAFELEAIPTDYAAA